MSAIRAAWFAGACLFVVACSKPPMPDPAPGPSSAADMPAPGDVAAAASANPPALPPPDMVPAEPVANDLGSAIVDGWVGEWKGPEGTSLRNTKEQVGYAVVVTNLDGPREFSGVASNEVLQFERDGVTETLHAGDGQATGMKWLADRKDCLVVKAGEGYCRD
jgi:hypothetical protein